MSTTISHTKNEWKAMLDSMQVDQEIPIDRINKSSAANCVSGYFHVFTEKRFSVTIDPDNKKKAIIRRLKDVEIEETKEAC